MLERLSTDSSIAPLVAQFVPLKVETDGPHWGQWSRKYSFTGNAIPILFVIRADGEKLYGQSGSKVGDELPRFLIAHLRNSGTIYNGQQLATIRSVVDDVKKSLLEGDTSAAIKRAESLRKLGTPGKLGSYAAVAKEADDLYLKLIEEGRATLSSAQQKLTAGDKFGGVLGVVSANRAYGGLPDLKKELAAAERDLSKTAELKVHVPDAEALDRALALAGQKTIAARKSGITALTAIVAKGAGSPAAEAARAKLVELGAEPPAAPTALPPGAATPATTPARGLRTWTDASGRFKLEAELVRVIDGKVELKRADGSVVAVPLDRLSAADQAAANGK